MILNYTCKKCGWTGPESSLDYENIDGCGGDDKLEICPKCGSEQVFVVFGK